MRYNNEISPSGFVFLFFCIIMIVLLSLWNGYGYGKHTGIKQIRIEAVTQGYAEWQCDDDGNITFVWKEGITVTPNKTVIEKVPRDQDTPLEPDIPFITDEMQDTIDSLNDGK